MRAALAVLTLALLAGCPTPPNEATPAAGGAGAPGGPGGGGPGAPGGGGPGGGGPGGGGPGGGGPGAGAPGGAPPGADAAGPAGAGGPAEGAPGSGSGGGGRPPGSPPPEGGVGGAVMRLDVPVRTAQDDIRDPVTISGTIKGKCAGKLVLDLVPPPPAAPAEPGSQPEEGGEVLGGPVTRAELSAVGAFTMKAPKGAAGALSAICDADSDGIIGRGDLISEAVELEGLTAPLADLELVLSAAGQPGTPPKAGEGVGSGTPPGAGAPAGGPSEGGAPAAGGDAQPPVEPTPPG